MRKSLEWLNDIFLPTERVFSLAVSVRAVVAEPVEYGLIDLSDYLDKFLGSLASDHRIHRAIVDSVEFHKVFIESLVFIEKIRLFVLDELQNLGVCFLVTLVRLLKRVIYELFFFCILHHYDCIIHILEIIEIQVQSLFKRNARDADFFVLGSRLASVLLCLLVQVYLLHLHFLSDEAEFFAQTDIEKAVQPTANKVVIGLIVLFRELVPHFHLFEFCRRAC